MVGSLLAGMGITTPPKTPSTHLGRSLQAPPELPRRVLRGLGMLALLGTLSIVSTVAGASSAPTPSPDGHCRGAASPSPLNLALFMSAFKLLTALELSWRDLLPA